VKEEMHMQRLCVAGVAALALTAASALAGERTVTLAVENMTCASCPYIVQQVLAGVPGVTGAAVSFEQKTAVVAFDDERTGVAALTAATEAMGCPSHPVDGPGG
jgi:mercuric ion binding protein